jgi:hypothetical protein
MAVFVPIIIVLLIAGGIAAVYFAWKQEQKRRDEMAALANEIGWRFDPDKDKSHDTEYAHFEIFRRGHSRAAYNTLTGSVAIAGRPYPAKMGDFTYKVTTSNGKTTTTVTYRFSYLILHLPFRGIPDLLIRREGFFDKIAGAFGFEDIDFESEAFSRAFHVKCAHKKFAYDVIHPRMMEFLMRNCPAAIDIEHCRCCLSDGKNRWEPQQFKGMLQWVDLFFAQWPEHVTASYD